MKIKLLLLALVFSGFALQSCSDDDDRHSGNIAVESTFGRMYPNATHVDWERKGSYHVVDFVWKEKKSEAWFDEVGNWCMTETDLLFTQLPEPVKTAFTQSEYATWHVDDVDMLERKDLEPVYVVEVKQGNQEYDLYYTAEGILIKAVLDTDDDNGHYLPTNLPEKAAAYISTTYPNAKIVEVEFERNVYEVDIIEGRVHRELQFNTSGEWLLTKTEDLPQSNVPQNVLTALQNSEYASYRIDDIDYYETPTGNYYLFDLESGSIEIKVKVNMEGVIIS